MYFRLVAMRRYVFVIALFSLWSGAASAADYLAWGKVSYMQNAYGGWLIKTDGATINPDNCSKDFVILEPTHVQYDELYSFILSSFMAERQIRLYVNGCHSAGYMKLSFLYTNGT